MPLERGSQSEKTDLERTAFHEAGHFIVANVIGLNFDVRISIRAGEDGTAGRVIGEGLDRAFKPPVERIEAQVVALCAGFVAQRRFDPDEHEAAAMAGAQSDFDQADEWSDVLGRAEALDRARALLDDHWTEVEIVARALLLRIELDAEDADLLAILASGDDDEKARSMWLLVDRGWDREGLESLARSVER